MTVRASVIIPVFNEEKVIKDCLESLMKQSYKNMELIVVDDGSIDKSVEIARRFNIKFFHQSHLGPGKARNLGAKYSTGEILIFIDADMVFDKDFIKELIKPIIRGMTVGTFSKEEYVFNKDNLWSKCWNINKNLPLDRMHPVNYPDEQEVFRAILKSEFDKVSGFDSIGYIDDYTLSEKLDKKASIAKGATLYHKNPSSLHEVFNQARWIGKSDFKRRKIRNEILMKLIALFRYSLPLSLYFGMLKSIKFQIPEFILFKIIYDLAVEISLLKSFFNEQPNK